MSMRFALSTSWNSDQYDSGTRVVQSILDIGFKRVELDFRFTKEKLSGVLPLVREKQVNIVSIHNYCPIPDDIPFEQAMPDVYSLSGIDDARRKKAVGYTKRTIETARELGAKAVVVHSGYVDIPQRTTELMQLFRQDKKNSEEYKKIQRTHVEERREKIKVHFDALTTSYAELLPFARDLKIRLGVENRFYYHEIPQPPESRELFRLFGHDVLGHWHDVGHAFVLESLGFFPLNYIFHEYQRYLIGIHYHDVRELKDHQVPGSGSVNFSYFKPWITLRKDIIEVLEAHLPAKGEDIVKGAQYLEKVIYK